MSELWGDEYRVFTTISFKNCVTAFALWHGALFCWKTKRSLIKLSPDGKAYSLRTLKSLFYLVMHPQNINVPLPWLTFSQIGTFF